MAVLIRYIHFLSIIILCGTLIVENLLIAKSLKRREITRMSTVDLVFGLSALSTLTAGLLMWFYYGKGAAFYMKNPVFHSKLGLFLIVGLISILPTMFFLKHRKGDQDQTVSVPDLVVWIVRSELALALVIPLFAVLMAKGIGLG
jgi:putative membrane protein